MKNRMCQTCLNYTCVHPADLNLWILLGHHPSCPDFKIDKESFAESLDRLVEQKFSTKIAAEIRKVEQKYEQREIKRKNPGITATLIQTRMFHWLNRKGHGSIVPNLKCFYTGEMDLCSVMKSGKISEYEIKISRKDFKQDFKKYDKHHAFGKISIGIYEGRNISRYSNHIFEYTAPNFFHYVVPKDMVTAEEVPDYAGLIYIDPENTWNFTTVKKAKQLHDRIITDEIREKIKTALMYRCWTAREKIEAMLGGEFRG